MTSHVNEQDRNIEKIESLISTLSDTVVDIRKEILDPSNEIVEPNILLEENLLANKSKSIREKTKTNTQSVSQRRTVTFDNKKNKITLKLSTKRVINPDPILNEKQKKNSQSSESLVIDYNETNVDIQNLEDIVSEDEYISGGFANLDHELQDELLNNLADEIDDELIRHNRRVPSIHSNEFIPNVTRSPIELWQRARILLAIHLYQIQNKTLDIHDTTSTTEKFNEPTVELNDFERLFTQKENLNERKIVIGLTTIQKLSLNSNERYQCVDFYDVGQGYIIICNIEQSEQTKLLVYPIEKKSSANIHSCEFDCSFQFQFIICIPIFRLLLGFVNIKPSKSLIVLLGDASRKGLFLSKQEIFNEIHSILYIHENAILFLGCLGRILQFNTQSLQYTSQPIFLSELPQLPFQFNESIIHLCQIGISQSIGILSHRYFLVWQYSSNQKYTRQFCNPYRYDFIRCLYIAKYDYIIFAFFDGLILIYQLNQMQQIRRYDQHWQMITDLKINFNENLLFSTSIDHSMNIWNIDTLQHIYQYKTTEEIYQINILEENLFFYRTSTNLHLFQLNLPNRLFSLTKSKVIGLKLFTNTHQTSRILALLEDYSSLLISPISGCCLTIIPNLSKKPIKQILHDITRSQIYSLQFNGEILLYQTDRNPCQAEYKIQTQSQQSMITCMTLIHPMHTNLVNIETFQISKEKSLEKQLIFFGHLNGYISLYQGDLFTMKSIQAHHTSILLLETSKVSMDKSNILFTNCEVLLSSSMDRLIYIWNLTINTYDESIQLIHLLTIEQEKNISMNNIQFLTMIDNFIVANYFEQKFLHIWQLLNISIKINDRDQWGIVEHPTKGTYHKSQIQAVSATTKLKLFASSDSNGCIKIWDNTNSLIRELIFDSTICAIEFLCFDGEFIFAYQNNLHLILAEDYLLNLKNKFSLKQQTISQILAEDKQLEIEQIFQLSYQSLPIFEYHIKTHHSKQRLQKFERQLAGRYAISESEDSESDLDIVSSSNSDQISTISDDPAWIDLADDVKDILRMKKFELRQQKH